MTNPKFRGLSSEVKDFLWNAFKQYHEQRGNNQPKPSMFMGDNQSLNMNTVNMFLDVPDLRTP